MKKIEGFINKLFKEPSDNFYIQVFRYGFSGAFVFMSDFLVLFVLTNCLGVHYLISTIAGALVGTTLSYIFNVNWVFKNRRFNKKSHELLVFAIISGIGFVMTPFLMWIFTDKIGIYYLYSKIIVTGVVVTSNFLAKKIILFPADTK